jgi:hypothetical protein
MSHYSVIVRATETLQDLLWAEFQHDNTITQSVHGKNEIVFANPTETARDSSNKLSLWLYQITENEFVKNQPPVRANNNGTGSISLQATPLALNLFYLVTPFTGDSKADQLLIGKTMQTLYDNAIVSLHSTVGGEEIEEELRVIFCRLTLEELTRIWEALQEPYRLSICYQVRVTRINSQRAVTRSRVVTRDADFSDQPQVEEDL